MAVIEDVVSRYERDDYPGDIGRRSREVIDEAFREDDEAAARLIVADALADMGPWFLRLVNEAAYAMPDDEMAQVAERLVNDVALSIVSSGLTLDRDDWAEARAALAAWHVRRLANVQHLCWAADAVEALPNGHPWRDLGLARRYLDEADELAAESGDPADRGMCVFARLALREYGDTQPGDLAGEMAQLVDKVPEDLRRAARHGILQACLAQAETEGDGELDLPAVVSDAEVRSTLRAIAADPDAAPVELAALGGLLDVGGDEEAAEAAFRKALARAEPRPDVTTATQLVGFLRLLWRRGKVTELAAAAQPLREVLGAAYHDAVDEVTAGDLGYSYWHTVAFEALALLELRDPAAAAAGVDASAGLRYLRDTAVRRSGQRGRVLELERGLRTLERGGVTDVVPAVGDLLSETYSMETRLRMEYRRLVAVSDPGAPVACGAQPVVTITDLLGLMLLAYYPDGTCSSPSRTAVLEPDAWSSPFGSASRWLDVYEGDLPSDEDGSLDEFVDAFVPVADEVSRLAAEIPADQPVWVEPHFGLGLNPWWACGALASRDTRVTLSRRMPSRGRTVAPGLEDGGRALVVSDPFGDLPAARLEGRYVAELLTNAGWQVDLLEGSAAGRADVLRLASGARLLHFAGHAAPRPWDPGSTSLLLDREIDEDPFPLLLRRIDTWRRPADDASGDSLRYGDVEGQRVVERWADGRLVERQLLRDDEALVVRYSATGEVEWWGDALSARELGSRGEFEDCALAFLSACGSSASDVSRYQHEPGGLAAAMLLAGADTVVGTLWPVGDLAALVFTKCFYEELTGGERDIHLVTRSAREKLGAMTGADASRALAAVARFAPFLETTLVLRAEAERLREVREPFARLRGHAAFQALSS